MNFAVARRRILPFTRSIRTHPTSVNPEEIAHFSRLSSQWWDEQGEFSFLHRMNPVRMRFIREKVLDIQNEAARPLQGLDALDVGCGGGLLSEVRPSFFIQPALTLYRV
jgi:2-polyprenyl-6-hydroxyphenyl methylase/3-demethylubiquinone-9 3-methyltransferase